MNSGSQTRPIGLETDLRGWGNFPVERCRVAPAASVEDARAAVATDGERGWIPRGLGRAYGDSALNAGGGVLNFTPSDLFLGFDEANGWLRCQAGVSLAEIIRYFLPRGWFLPTTPGTKFITVGGAIAADVHGKNHHRDGSFGNFVRSFRLLLASGEIVTCSREENADLFRATLGGMGLTGCIVDAEFRLTRVPSRFAAVDYVRTADLDQTLAAFSRSDTEYRYSVAWIDCLAKGASLGRSVVMLGNDAAVDELPAAARANPCTTRARRPRRVPFMMPGWVLNSYFVSLFNSVYYAAHGDGRRIVDFEKFFYPLDGVLAWNRIYGRRGFVQFQALFPKATSRAGLLRLLTEIAQSRRSSFLAVLKACGPAGEGLLSYLYPGHTLALDFPNTGADLVPFIARLEQIVLDFGGRLYLAKDALMTPAAFAQMYPRLPEFLEIKRRVDPAGVFQSSQSRRLGITG